jgi:gamma-glutamyl:cysteine ligase YbdK (ATP-grasp superfamily)
MPPQPVQACRYGLAGRWWTRHRRTVSLGQDLLDTLKLVTPHAGVLGNGEALAQLAAGVEAGYSGCRLAATRSTAARIVERRRAGAERLWMGLIGTRGDDA